MRTWAETFALLAASFVSGAALAGLVYLAELGTRLVPVQPWTWGTVIA